MLPPPQLSRESVSKTFLTKNKNMTWYVSLEDIFRTICCRSFLLFSYKRGLRCLVMVFFESTFSQSSNLGRFGKPKNQISFQNLKTYCPTDNRFNSAALPNLQLHFLEIFFSKNNFFFEHRTQLRTLPSTETERQTIFISWKIKFSFSTVWLAQHKNTR